MAGIRFFSFLLGLGLWVVGGILGIFFGSFDYFICLDVTLFLCFILTGLVFIFFYIFLLSPLFFFYIN